MTRSFGAALLCGLALRGFLLRDVDPGPMRNLFATPWDRVPLLDLAAVVSFRSIGLLAILSAAATIGLAGMLGKELHGRAAPVAWLAALAPPLVQGGTRFTPLLLVVPLCAFTAWETIRVLRGERAGRLLAAASLLGLSDWTALPPLLAWSAWLLLLPPAALPPAAARRAGRIHAIAAVLAILAGAALIASGTRPETLFRAAELPSGLAAVRAHLDGLSGLFVGRFPRPPIVSLGIAALGFAAFTLGLRRGDLLAASVLAAGAAFVLLPAWILHPWIPVAWDKHLWYATPMLLAGLSALWPRRRWVVAAALCAGCHDADDDGFFREQGDCDDETASTYPGAPDVWGDGIDNDCDGGVDSSDEYAFFDESEPNDASLSDCFAPGGQAVPPLASWGLLNRVAGRIDDIGVEGDYEDGDRDCFQLRLPEDDEERRLSVRLAWDDAGSDLDFALQGLWEGEQAGFAVGNASGPGPEFALSSAAFSSGEALWVWVVGYAGVPTGYTLELVLR